MSEHSHDKPDEQQHPSPPEPAPDPLDGALNALQGILEQRHVVPEGRGDEPPGEPPPDPDPENLPLLDDVVIPGAGVEPEPEPAPGHPPAWAASPHAGQQQTLPPYNDLIKRLASEVDVIIEECVEEALETARRELVARIKSHLDIVMPEILEELSLRSARERDRD